MKDLVIIGSDLVALTASYMLKNDFNVKIINPNFLFKDDITSIGNKFFFEDSEIIDFFEEINIPFNIDFLYRGIFIKNEVHDIINYFTSISIERHKKIKDSYFSKTRKFNCNLDSSFVRKNITSETFSWVKSKVKRSKNYIFFDGNTLLETLINICDIEIYRSKIKNISVKTIELDGIKLHYDVLIFTLPIWEIDKFIWWNIPKCNVIKKNLIKVNTLDNLYLHWDYVFTPFTPGNVISGFSQYDGEYAVEMNGDITSNMHNLFSDLYFLFGNNWYIEKIETIKGNFIYQLDSIIKQKENIYFLGEYSEFNHNLFFSKVLKKIKKIKENWS